MFRKDYYIPLDDLDVGRKANDKAAGAFQAVDGSTEEPFAVFALEVLLGQREFLHLMDAHHFEDAAAGSMPFIYIERKDDILRDEKGKEVASLKELEKQIPDQQQTIALDAGDLVKDILKDARATKQTSLPCTNIILLTSCS